MEMFYLNRYNYENNQYESIYYDTYINVKEKQKELAYEYIISKQGDIYNVKYEDLIYEGNKKPIRNRREKIAPFYIKKSKDPNKISIREYKKDYGYIWNGYNDIKHLKYTMCKINNNVIKNYYKEKFQDKDKYNEVIKKLDEFNNIDLFSEYFMSESDEQINAFSEIEERSKSAPLPIIYNN